MLNWYANTFRISEKNITKAGLLRTKVFAWMMLMIVPLEMLGSDWIDNPKNLIISSLGAVAIVLSLIGWIALLLSPLVHRFWAPDKYLDEWEIEVKRKGMAAGYKVLFGALVIGLIYSAVFTEYGEATTKSLSYFRLDSLAFAVLILTFGIQTLVQLRLIRPIDQEDVEDEMQKGHSIWGRIAVVFAIFMLFFGPAFFQGLVDGWNESSTAETSQSLKYDGGASE